MQAQTFKNNKKQLMIYLQKQFLYEIVHNHPIVKIITFVTEDKISLQHNNEFSKPILRYNNNL